MPRSEERKITVSDTNKVIPEVTVEEVKRAMDANESFILLDVRTTGEFVRGSLKGSINVPVDEVEQKILTVIPDLHAKVYVYCLSGSRSMYAVGEMLKLGYTQVFDVSHGLLAWRVKGYLVG